MGANAAGLVLHQSAQRGEIAALQATNPNDGTACTSPTAGCLVRRSAFTGPATPRLSNTQAGAYAQDTWSTSRYSVFHAGLRTAWDPFTQTAMAEPRLSANVLPSGDDRAQVPARWRTHSGPPDPAPH